MCNDILIKKDLCKKSLGGPPSLSFSLYFLWRGEEVSACWRWFFVKNFNCLECGDLRCRGLLGGMHFSLSSLLSLSGKKKKKK